MDLGAHIAYWRKAKGLTQKQLADRVGVSVAAVYQWEGSGESKTQPSALNLIAIVDALGISMDRFLKPVPKAS